MRNGNVSKTRAVLGTTRIDPSPKRAGRVESRGPPIKNSPRSIPVNPVIARAGVWKSASFAYLVGNWNIFRLVRFYCEYDVAEHFSFILEFSLLSCVYVSVCVCVYFCAKKGDHFYWFRIDFPYEWKNLRRFSRCGNMRIYKSDNVLLSVVRNLYFYYEFFKLFKFKM